MKKSALANEDCAIARAASIVGDWWSLLIVREALAGCGRFNEFASRLELAKNVLADRLKKLVAAGVLEQKPAADGTSYSEYGLTKKGLDLWIVLVAMRQWSDRWIAPSEERLVEARTGEPVGELKLHARDGRTLELFDLALVSPEAEGKNEPDRASLHDDDAKGRNRPRSSPARRRVRERRVQSA